MQFLRYLHFKNHQISCDVEEMHPNQMNVSKEAGWGFSVRGIEKMAENSCLGRSNSGVSP
jgi:hypothetical protein